eukprot:gene39039-52743_t
MAHCQPDCRGPVAAELVASPPGTRVLCRCCRGKGEHHEQRNPERRSAQQDGLEARPGHKGALEAESAEDPESGWLRYAEAGPGKMERHQHALSADQGGAGFWVLLTRRLRAELC